MNLHEFKREFRKEFGDTITNTIWQDDHGIYEVFDKYKIRPDRHQYHVTCHSTEVGAFSTSRSALSWCIADKFSDYNLAQKLLNLDNALANVTRDISARAQIADRSRDPEFRETVAIKLETKLIHKKILENDLANCVNLAKYLQQRGFDNETARTGRGQPSKTNR
jgi:hypothetical protein